MRGLAGLGLAFILAAASCGGSGDSAAQGAEGGTCFPNGTCNAGLTCSSNKCAAMTANGCTEGQVFTCACSDGSQATQTCTAAGTLGACACGSGAGGAVGTGGSQPSGGTGALGGSAGVAPAQGDKGGACYGNGTCNAGLTCASGLCVVPSGAGGADSGAAGSASTSQDSGTGGVAQDDNDASAPDASTSGGSGGAGGTTSTGLVSCGANECSISAGEACTYTNGNNPTCSTQMPLCTGCTITVIGCDEQSDCAGSICCYATSTIHAVSCLPSCVGSSPFWAYRICDPSSPDCAQGESCLPAGGLPSGYFTCQ